MGQKNEKKDKICLHYDFEFVKETDLNTQIAAFAAAHEAEHRQILAMDSRRPLGVGKVRVTFRIIEKRRSK